MFSKYFSAKLRSSKITASVLKGDRQKKIEISLHYEFTEDLAKCLGERAIAVQQMLASSLDARLTMASTNLALDTETVKATFEFNKVNIHTIEQTNGITLKAKAPNAEDPSPTITAKLITELSTDHLTFVGEYLDEIVDVRLDRKQLEIAGAEGK